MMQYCILCDTGIVAGPLVDTGKENLSKQLEDEEEWQNHAEMVLVSATALVFLFVRFYLSNPTAHLRASLTFFFLSNTYAQEFVPN